MVNSQHQYASKIYSCYLWEQIRHHVNLFFPVRASEALQKVEVVFVPLQEALCLRKRIIAVPTDICSPRTPDSPYVVSFAGTKITLWNRLQIPMDQGWHALPNFSKPLWYQHDSGTLIPAYNMYANLLDLLTLREERETSERDTHGRFPTANSPRMRMGLLQVPAFNEAVAVLIAACLGLILDGRPLLHLEGLQPSLVLVLSHDCDILMGNDIYTQGVRLLRVFLPLLSTRRPQLRNLRWMLHNALKPKTFYMDDLDRMVQLEAHFGYDSSFYMLNGARGRLKSRTKPCAIFEAGQRIPDGWNIGIHYNYDTFLDGDRFHAQKRSLEKLLGRQITSGRAHYLRFDPETSWVFLKEQGITCDESLGYPDHVGYRCGIGGAFQPFSVSGREKIDMWEIPLVVMEDALANQYPHDPLRGFEDLISHLRCLGGALSILFHPGTFQNPEFPTLAGLYERMLGLASHHKCVGKSATSLLSEF